MERIRATSKMSFINGGLSQKTVIGCNNNNNYFIPPSDHHHHHHFLARCTVLDDSSELSIFDAKKYFNEVSSNCINKVSPVTSLDSTSISEDHLCEVRDSDQDSESRSKSSWACGVTHPVSPTVVSKFSPTSTSAPVDGYRHRSYHARSFHSATPTASSEASWNSQTGLLSNPPGAISVSVLRGDSDHDLEKKTRRPLSASSAAARWIFRSSKCPCSGKKSVQVQELKVIVSSDHLKTSPPNNYINNNPPQPSPPESLSDPVNTTIAIVGENTMVLQQSDQNDVVWSTQRRFPPNLLLQGQTTTQRVIASTGFTFPILKNNNGEFPIRAVNASLIQDPPRDSLEVFRPSSARDDGGTSLKSRILASAVASGATAATIDIDDVASDASSDLFEIESFSTQTASTAATYPAAAMFHRRDSMELEARRLTHRSLDEPMIPSAEWYEPSEASIDWSVTTAEGFDKASIANMSEADELPTEKNNNNRRRSSSGSGLLSCRSEKAVSVGPQPVKFITGGEKKVHVGSRPPLGKKPPLARSNSARQSLAFAA